MAWRGFLKESKSYMNYPECGRFRFWLYFLIAYYKFYTFMKKSKKTLDK